ncbi:hypothetical protein ACIQTZ_18400 [Paenarthrobacter sp. NPDC090520]|uniref:hypothetical protein n=1 Tax=Paenarthrobacter sp. NPDC090520 TaxID=3364382 RepID=UPI003808501E
MNQPSSLSRRSILRLFPAAAVAGAAVVLSAREALAKDSAPARNQDHSAEAMQAPRGHRSIIGVL